MNMKNTKPIPRDINWKKHQGEIYGQILDADENTVLIVGRITPSKTKFATRYLVMCTIPGVRPGVYKKSSDLESAKRFLSKQFKGFVKKKADELKNYVK